MARNNGVVVSQVTVDPLLVDVYADDLGGKPDWSKLVAAGPPWHGAIVKCTEGLHYAPSWFGEQWQALRDAAGARLGVTFFRGAYHYLRFDQDPVQQANLFVNQIETAGGWADNDLYPIVDVERANNGTPTRQAVMWSVYDFATTVKRISGRGCVTLYGGELLYSLGIRDRMGCNKLWIARYAPTLPSYVYERIGWTRDDLFAWQYQDTNVHGYGLHGYPTTSPMGPVDLSAVVISGGGDNALRWLRG